MIKEGISTSLYRGVFLFVVRYIGVRYVFFANKYMPTFQCCALKLLNIDFHDGGQHCINTG